MVARYVGTVEVQPRYEHVGYLSAQNQPYYAVHDLGRWVVGATVAVAAGAALLAAIGGASDGYRGRTAVLAVLGAALGCLAYWLVRG